MSSQNPYVVETHCYYGRCESLKRGDYEGIIKTKKMQNGRLVDDKIYVKHWGGHLRWKKDGYYEHKLIIENSGNVHVIHGFPEKEYERLMHWRCEPRPT